GASWPMRLGFLPAAGCIRVNGATATSFLRRPKAPTTCRPRCPCAVTKASSRACTRARNRLDFASARRAGKRFQSPCKGGGGEGGLHPRNATNGGGGVELPERTAPPPDGGTHPLHRAAADVADGEDPLDPRLQRQRRAVGREHVGAGSDEAFLVEGDVAAGEPTRCRIGAGEEEQVGDGVLVLATGA